MLNNVKEIKIDIMLHMSTALGTNSKEGWFLNFKGNVYGVQGSISHANWIWWNTAGGGSLVEYMRVRAKNIVLTHGIDIHKDALHRKHERIYKGSPIFLAPQTF